MALVLADRVRETTTVTGTGTATLLGAVSGYQSFSAVGNANTTYYVIANQSATEWEVGIGTYTASGTLLSRDTVLSSSNSGSLVNFSAGTKDVFVDYPAGKAVYEDAAGNVDGYPITGGTINNTTVGATTPSTGVFTTLTANTSVTTPIVGAATGSSTTGLDLNVNNKTQARIVEIGDGTRPLVINGGSAGGAQSPGISAPVNLHLSSGTSARVIFYTNGRSTTQQAEISHTASAVNYHQLTGGATTKGVIQSAQGSDTNIAQVFQSKGTGAIDLAAGSSGVNISNGGTVTAITRTNNGTGYTSAPTVAITAPTTAGGVQATATATVSAGSLTGITITNAGSGYVEQPTVTFSGGGGSGAAAYATVGSGTVVKSIGSTMSFNTPGGEQIRVTGGSGTSTGYLNLSGSTSSSNGVYLTSSANAMYFSASAGNNFRFFTNGEGIAEQLRVSHTASAVNYVQVTGAATAAYAQISAQGSDTNPGILYTTKGTGEHRFSTAASITAIQFRVRHINSPANYCAVIGAPTGSAPEFQTLGTDTNIDLALTPKGTGRVKFGTYTANMALTIQGYIEILDSGGTIRKLAVIA